MNRNNANMNNMNQDTEDEIASFHDEEDENILYIHKKELVHLEGDKSIEIENSYDVDHTYSNQDFGYAEVKEPCKKKPNELMKFISDSSEFYERPHSILQSIPTKIEENYLQPPNRNNNELIPSMNYLTVTSFDYFVQGSEYKPVVTSSFNQSGPSFRMSMSKEMEGKYKELRTEHDQVLALLQHWQKFYLDIVGVLSSQNTLETVDYFSQGFQDSITEELKTLIKIAKEKEMMHSMSFSNKLFEFAHECSLSIAARIKDRESEMQWAYYRIESKAFSFVKNEAFKSKRLQTPSKTMLSMRIESVMFEISNAYPRQLQSKRVKTTLRNYEATDGLNALPPMQFIQKKINSIDIGIQTIDYKEKEKEPSGLHQFNLDVISLNQPIRLTFIHRKSIQLLLKAESRFQLLTTHQPQAHQFAETQTDLTQRMIDSLSATNKDLTAKQKQSQQDKDELKEFYEEKLSALNEQLEESKQQQQQQMNTSIVDPISNFLPELIPPEQTYKIFICKPIQINSPCVDCVKHFKYEEELYKKFMEEADLKCLKTFVIKMDNYITGCSIPCFRQIIPSSKKVSNRLNTL